jgi:Dynamin family
VQAPPEPVQPAQTPEAEEPEGPAGDPPPIEDSESAGESAADEEPAPIPREPALVGSLRRVRAELAAIRFPLALPDAGTAAESARALATQLDDYLLPRLARLDAPLLVVVGGSTGAGKSTLVNSLVRAPVSPAGVLRPTTRAPVLVSAPGDTRWFLGPPDTGADADRYLLPHLVRTTGLDAEPGALRVISAPGLRRGLALLDAPDLDSVVAANRALV